MKLDHYIHAKLRGDDELVHMEEMPAREAAFAALDPALPPVLQTTLHDMGIARLYSHQAEAIGHVRNHRHTVIVTSTASGKTLCYNLPVLQWQLEDPQSRALYLFPTKALAQDQLKTLLRFSELDKRIVFRAGTYDGDTPPDLRRRLRDTGNIILSNPDMLHQGILPNHTKWATFFSNLKAIVIDEIHTYRGVFGSNVANVMRRLKRVARHYGSDPVFVACSATINNPEELTSRIIGEEVVAVKNDGSPRGPRTVVMMNPAKLDDTGLARRGPYGVARRIVTDLVKNRIQTIAFVRTRMGSEIVYRYCKETLMKESPTLAGALRAYRGGYLPELRREIEQGIASGKILGIASTNALELGIDIGSLQAAVIVGYPGSIASLWQQAGRAGRGTERALVVMVAHNSPIDQYLMNNPEYVLERNPENAIVDPDNPHLLVYHLRCAAQELPMDAPAVKQFGKQAQAVADLLTERGDLAKTRTRYYWTGEDYPAGQIGLRNLTAEVVTIQEAGTSRIIGTIDEDSAYFEVHEQAVYLHGAETYFVEQLDLEKKVAFIEKRDLDYFTKAISESNIVIDEIDTHRPVEPDSKLGLGDVTVTTVVPMFKKVKFGSRESIGYGKIDLPPQKLETTSVWLVPSAKACGRVISYGRTPVESLIGVANVLVDIARLHIMCDPSDIGTVVDSSNLGSATLFVYDRHSGGMGYAERAYTLFEKILEDVLRLIRQCPCQDGCPSCVGAPMPQYAQTAIDSGTRGVLPDKEAALVLLHDILGKEPYVPRYAPRKLGTDGQGRTDEELAEQSLGQTEPLPLQLEKKIRKRMGRLREE